MFYINPVLSDNPLAVHNLGIFPDLFGLIVKGPVDFVTTYVPCMSYFNGLYSF